MRRTLVLIVTLSACADSALDYETYLSDYDVARCKRRVRCGAIPDVDACLQRLVDPLTPDPDIRDAIELQKMTWDADAAAACIDWIENVTCDATSPEFRRPQIACAEAVTGALHDGETCTRSDECISNECWKGDLPCTDACCLGTCAGDIAPEFGRIGERCRLSGCIDSRCEDSICVPLRTEGEPCYRDAECDYGLGCVYGECTALAAAGEPCAFDGGCRDYGLVCKWPFFTCEPGGLGRDHCLDDGDCSPMYRCETSTNNIDTYFCTQRIGLGPGSKCEWNGSRCAAPAFCRFESGSLAGTCMLPQVDGARCYTDAECTSHRCNEQNVCTSTACL